MELVELLLERARNFRTVAEMLINADLIDVAVFNLEQAAQLRLKATLLRLCGSYPRVHNIRFLLSEVARVLESMGLNDVARKVVEFVRSRRNELAILEEAYTEARYGARRYTRTEAKELLSIVDEVFQLVEWVEHTALG